MNSISTTQENTNSKPDGFDATLFMVAKYQVLSLINSGGMGDVYKAYDPQIDRYVAIKTIRDRMDQLKLNRFKAEVQSAGKLNHNKIVAAYEFGEFDGKPFIAMEYVPGNSLKYFFDLGERFPLETALKIMYQLLDAISFMHENGVIHRDIKPDNILVMEDGNIKVSDFGIAHINTSNLTRIGDVMGTPGYMSPEQWFGQPADERTDIFSAGVILYQFLTGEKPFPGTSSQVVMHQTLDNEPLPVSKLNNRLGPEIDAIVSKALSKNPALRFRSAKAFLAELKATSQKMNTANQSRRMGRKGLAARVIGGMAVFIFLGRLYGLRPEIWSQDRPGDVQTDALNDKAESAQAEFKTGAVEVTSEPSGAVVMIDDQKFMGVTPVRVTLSPGQHHFMLTKDGYHPLEASIDVEASARIPFDVKLAKIE